MCTGAVKSHITDFAYDNIMLSDKFGGQEND